MKRFYLRVTATSPLAIRSDHAEGGVKTAAYIPGATLLGSLASAHRILRSEQEKEFTRLFLHEQVHFPHLYPASFEVSNFHDRNLPVLPLPKTAQTCKRYSGFQLVEGEIADDERHGIRDSLLDWGIFSLLNKEQLPIRALLSPLTGHDTCAYAQGRYATTHCGQLMDHVSNPYYRRVGSGLQRLQPKNTRRLQTRTGINREWGVVEESILYNREVFNEKARFWGEVLLPDELAPIFQSFVKEAQEEQVIRIGTGRTRGLGRVDITMVDMGQQHTPNFKKRLTTFSDTIREQASDAKVQNIRHFYFAITLQSPTILCDEFLRYQKTLSPSSLRTILGLSKSDSYTFEPVYQSVGIQRITGWNELWGTPRPTDYAMEMGSVFLFSCAQKLDDTLIEALQRAEEQGIGRRLAEGFGRISISDPFHLEREQA